MTISPLRQSGAEGGDVSYDRKTTQATIEALADLFPACFALFQQRRKPLKLGIRDDVLAALNGAITVKEAGLALKIYTSNRFYLQASIEGAVRIDLNGNTAGHVTAEEAANAKQRLAAQRDKWKRQLEAKAKAKATAEVKAKNAGRISLDGLRAAAQARRAAAA
jgi:ProP effector